MIKYNTKNIVSQRFPFKSPIINYIWKNVQPQHLLKLYQCSKYFFNKYRLNIIRNLEIVDDWYNKYEKLDPTKTVIDAGSSLLDKFQNFWITDSFFYRERGFFLNFTNCTIKKLELSPFVLWETYVSLTQAGTVEEMIISSVYGNYIYLPIEELITKVPKATFIQINKSVISPNSMTALSSMKHSGKLTHFELRGFTDSSLLDAVGVAKFVARNSIDNCIVKCEHEIPEIITEENAAAVQAMKEFNVSYNAKVAENIKVYKNVK